MSPLLAYVLGIVTGVLGTAAGIEARDGIRQIGRKHNDAGANEMPYSTSRGRHILRVLIGVLVAVILAQIAIGVLLLVTRGNVADQAEKLAAQDAEQDEFVACQAEFNQRWALAQTPRSEAAEQRDAALTEFLNFSAQLSGEEPTPAQEGRARELFLELRDASQHLQDVRDRFPLPGAPAATCGPTPP